MWFFEPKFEVERTSNWHWIDYYLYWFWAFWDSDVKTDKKKLAKLYILVYNGPQWVEVTIPLCLELKSCMKNNWICTMTFFYVRDRQLNNGLKNSNVVDVYYIISLNNWQPNCFVGLEADAAAEASWGHSDLKFWQTTFLLYVNIHTKFNQNRRWSCFWVSNTVFFKVFIFILYLSIAAQVKIKLHNENKF